MDKATYRANGHYTTMDKAMNRYIKAMEIGLANEKDGISYFDLVDQLENQLKYKFNYSAEYTFLSWFVDNFRYKGEYINKEIFIGNVDWFLKDKVGYGYASEYRSGVASVKYTLSQKFYLNGEAAKQYLDYLELKESRIAATQARKQSNFSIAIAIGAILISTILGWYTIRTAPQPPYDVKIMEDRTKTNELEKENEKLKEKLIQVDSIEQAIELDLKY
jgi:hypothetical protein